MTEDNSQLSSPFVHLHVHSEYSLMDGSIRIRDLIQKVKKQGHRAVALTDHGNLFGAVEFYNKAKAAGVKPIIGCEIYTTSFSENPDEAENEDHVYHLVLLAKNNAGYKNLLKIVSYGYTEGLQQVPVVPIHRVFEHNEGLVVLSACNMGQLSSYFWEMSRVQSNLESDEVSFAQEFWSHQECFNSAKRFCEHFKSTFKSDFYIELIDNNLPDQRPLIKMASDFAKHFQVPIVASADAHYLNAEDQDVHTVLLAVKNGMTMAELRDRRRDFRFHVLDNSEMVGLFSDFPEALKNSLEIADKCNVEIEFGKYYLPKYQIGEETSDESLKRLSHEGLKKRIEEISVVSPGYFNEEKITEYEKRLNHELDVIINMGFPGYFLIVQDFINWAKDNDIPVGPGRGSGAGSLVAYVLRITDIDPIPYNLIFERFLNPERVSMPDFDVDFCQWRREEVISYVIQKYGAENVAQIITFGEMKAKAALKSIGRALGMPYTKADKFTKLIPNELNITLDKALAVEPRLKEEMANDPGLDELMDYALKVEGLKSHTSVHAAGVVISDGAMTNFVPIYKTEDDPSLITQYEMKNAEKVGLVKFDFLGLKTLTVIKKAVDLIKVDKDPEFDIARIDIEDQSVFDLIGAGKTIGVFQLEGTGMQQLNLKLKPSCFEDIIAVVALFRPGPLGSGMVDDFIERKHGRQKIEYPHELTTDILRETYGIILYQEQVQKIAVVMANYTLGEADLLRRAMGKKIPEEMVKQKKRFVDGCISNNIDQKLSEDLFDLMAHFAEYGFNKSHSAAYGLISYQTAYLKAHYPSQFMAAIMSCDMDRTDKIIRYCEDCVQSGIEILVPDINESIYEFHPVSDQTIRFGLGAIKGLGEACVEMIVAERDKNGPFKSLFDLACRVPLNHFGKKNLELLVKVGALDSFKIMRPDLLSIIPEVVEYSIAHHDAKSKGQRSLFDLSDNDQEFTTSRETSWDEDALRAKAANAVTDENWLIEEKALLGVFLSEHPVSRYEDDVKYFSLTEVHHLESMGRQVQEKKAINVLGFVSEVSERRTKRGSRIAYIKLENRYGSYEGMMFEKDLEAYGLPEVDTVTIGAGFMDRGFDGTGFRINFERFLSLEEFRMNAIKSAKLLVTPLIDKDTENEPAHDIERLWQILNRHQGDTPLSIEMLYNNVSLQLQPRHQIKVGLTNDCIKELKSLSSLGLNLQYSRNELPTAQ